MPQLSDLFSFHRGHAVSSSRVSGYRMVYREEDFDNQAANRPISVTPLAFHFSDNKNPVALLEEGDFVVRVKSYASGIYQVLHIQGIPKVETMSIEVGENLIVARFKEEVKKFIKIIPVEYWATFLKLAFFQAGQINQMLGSGPRDCVDFESLRQCSIFFDFKEGIASGLVKGLNRMKSIYLMERTHRFYQFLLRRIADTMAAEICNGNDSIIAEMERSLAFDLMVGPSWPSTSNNM